MVSRTHEGLVRVNNEDCVHVDSHRGFAVLADGMGGLLAGEEASAVAVESICRRLVDANEHPTTAAALEKVILAAHDAVLQHAKELNYVGKMGTTLLVWAHSEDASSAVFGHVGDSRLYSFVDGTLTRETTDHTVAQRMIDMGQFPADQAYRAPNRHVLTQAVGLPGVCVPTCDVMGDANRRLLLCSDGLSDMINDQRLGELLAEPDLERCADVLIAEALAEGGRDNVTIALIDQ